MKLYAPLLLPLFALAACGEEPAPEAAPAEVATPEPIVSAPAPDEMFFTQLHAETCPDAEPVSGAFCQRAMGAQTASCEFSLGEDEVLRNDATLELDDEGQNWSIVDPEAVCAQ